MDEKVLADLRRLLEQERERLVEEIDEYDRDGQESVLEASGENNYRDHMADQGSATFSRELNVTLEDAAKIHLALVDRALTRMDEGTYGACQRCGERIAASRLEAVPSAELCIGCKEWEETH